MISRGFQRGRNIAFNYAFVLFVGVLVQHANPAFGGGEDYNLCESSCPSFEFSIEGLTKLASIDFSGESLQGTVYKETVNEILIGVSAYTSIFEGTAVIKKTDDGHHVRFTYVVHSNTRETISGPNAIICQYTKGGSVYFSCYQNLGDEDDIARRLAEDKLSNIMQRVSELSNNSDLFGLTNKFSGRKKPRR